MSLLRRPALARTDPDVLAPEGRVSLPALAELVRSRLVAETEGRRGFLAGAVGSVEGVGTGDLARLRVGYVARGRTEVAASLSLLHGDLVVGRVSGDHPAGTGARDSSSVLPLDADGGETLRFANALVSRLLRVRRTAPRASTADLRAVLDLLDRRGPGEPLTTSYRGAREPGRREVERDLALLTLLEDGAPRAWALRRVASGGPR